MQAKSRQCSVLCPIQYLCVHFEAWSQHVSDTKYMINDPDKAAHPLSATLNF